MSKSMQVMIVEDDALLAMEDFPVQVIPARGSHRPLLSPLPTSATFCFAARFMAPGWLRR
jgi:hypothetical protein